MDTWTKVLRRILAILGLLLEIINVILRFIENQADKEQ